VELPHLSLYIRRALRRPSTGTMYILVLWAAMFAARFSGGNQIILPAYYWLTPFDLGTLCILIGNFVLYFVIARQMGRLARGEDGREPDWYATPISDGAAVLGALATTGLAALIPLALLVVFVLLDAHTAGTSWPEFGPALWFSLIRLPHFALLAACLMLALRRSALTRSLPWILATAAMLTAFWDVSLIYHHYATGYALGDIRWVSCCLAVGLALLIAVQAWLASLSAHGSVRADLYLALGAVTAIPALFSLVYFADAFTSSIRIYQLGFGFHTILHATYANMFADVHPLMVTDTGYSQVLMNLGDGSNLPAGCVLYGWRVDLPVAVALLNATYAVALILWWYAACRCLRAARTSDASSS